MQKIAYTNETKTPQFFGGIMVPTGETREIDPTFLPSWRPATASTSNNTPVHIVDHLLAQPVSVILTAIPSLCIEDVDLMGEKEQEGAARKEILSVLAERLLSEANNKEGPIVLSTADQSAADKVAADKLAADQAEADKVAADKADTDKAAADQAEAQKTEKKGKAK